MFYQYGEKEIAYLKSKDAKLGQAIDIIGHIDRPVEEDLFGSIVHAIIGQQISAAAQVTVWNRMMSSLGEITPEALCATSVADIQKHGTTFRKAEYIQNFADKVQRGEFNISTLETKSDAEIIAGLSSLRGIGIWTAEMIMVFSMQRPNILSYGDLAIHRGMRMLYHHRNIDEKLFDKYRRRYSPYASVASLYLWTIAAGKIEGMRDYAPKKRMVKK